MDGNVIISSAVDDGRRLDREESDFDDDEFRRKNLLKWLNNFLSNHDVEFVVAVEEDDDDTDGAQLFLLS